MPDHNEQMIEAALMGDRAALERLMSPNGAPLSRQGKQWQLHSCCVVVVVRAISSMYVVRSEPSCVAHTPPQWIV